MKLKKSLKKTMCVLFGILMIFSVCTVGISAQEVPSDEEGIMPLWDSIHIMDLTLTFYDGYGYATGTAVRQITSTSIEGTITVYEYCNGEWEYVDSWYKSTTRNSLVMDHGFPAETGVTYKAVFEVTAYTENTPESASLEDVRLCPQMP